MVRELGADGDAWRKLARWRARMGDAKFAGLTLGPLPLVGPALALGLPSLVRLGLAELNSSGSYAERFRTAAAQRIVPQLSLHADVGPDDPAGAPIGLVLALSALSVGFPVAQGGTGAITRALLRRLQEAGGVVQLGARVSKVIVRGGAAVGVRTTAGEEIEARAVLADTSAPTLCLELVGEEHLPGRLVEAMRGFAHGWGTFKVDWALDGPVPWSSPSAREAAVVHLGGDIPELRAFTTQVRRGELPAHPYLVLGQQSLCDPSRAPAGKHTLWGYSHVPSKLPGGWASASPSPTASTTRSRRSPPASRSWCAAARSAPLPCWKRGTRTWSAATWAAAARSFTTSSSGARPSLTTTTALGCAGSTSARPRRTRARACTAPAAGTRRTSRCGTSRNRTPPAHDGPGALKLALSWV
jgi:phytoene dehydrogenase-like protein